MTVRVERFGDLFEFLPKSGLKASEGQQNGAFPFFTSSSEQSKWTDAPVYSEEALVFATGGAAAVHHVTGRFAASADCLVASPSRSSLIDARYAYRYLTYNINAIEAGFRGAGLRHVSKGFIQDLSIPVPRLSRQRRIAEILDKADALRTKRRTALAQLDSLTQSTFLDMFGDPAAQGWRMSTVAGIAADSDNAIRTGPFGSQLLHSEFTDGGIAVLGIDNAVANEFRWGQRRFISEAKYRQLSRYTVYPGDVLITIMGTCGRCAIVPDGVPKAINTKHLCCISLDYTKCLPSFLHAYFLGHPIARRYLAQKAKGAIMEGLNKSIIREMPIPLAPIEVQVRFGERLKQLSDVRAKLRRSEDELEVLFASLQHRAFRGEL